MWVTSAAERLCPVWAALVRRRCGCLDVRVGDFTLSNLRNAANGGLLYRSPGFEIGRCGSEIPPTRPVWPEKVLTAPRPDEGGKASHLRNRTPGGWLWSGFNRASSKARAHAGLWSTSRYAGLRGEGSIPVPLPPPATLLPRPPGQWMGWKSPNKDGLFLSTSCTGD